MVDPNKSLPDKIIMSYNGWLGSQKATTCPSSCNCKCYKIHGEPGDCTPIEWPPGQKPDTITLPPIRWDDVAANTHVNVCAIPFVQIDKDKGFDLDYINTNVPCLLDQDAISVYKNKNKTNKILISIGGAQTQDFGVLAKGWANTAATQVINYLGTHNFDGIDFDLEGSWYHEENVDVFNSFIKQVHGAGYIISMAPQYDYLNPNSPDGPSKKSQKNNYMPFLKYKDHVDIIAYQFYNNSGGDVLPNDAETFNKTLLDSFIPKLDKDYWHLGFTEADLKKIVIGKPCNPSAFVAPAGGYTPPTTILDTYNDLKTDPYNRTIGGFMFWHLSSDCLQNYSFSNELSK